MWDRREGFWKLPLPLERGKERFGRKKREENKRFVSYFTRQPKYKLCPEY